MANTLVHEDHANKKYC